MLASDFQAKLRRLNPKLRIFCGDSKYPAGIFTVKQGEYQEICGIDKNYVPEFQEMDPTTGVFVRGGWRRAIQILIKQKYVDRKHAERVFNTHFDGRGNRYIFNSEDRIEKEINSAQIRGFERTGKAGIQKDDLADLAHEISKEAVSQGQEA